MRTYTRLITPQLNPSLFFQKAVQQSVGPVKPGSQKVAEVKQLNQKKRISRDARHYLVKRPNQILTSRLSWNQVQGELREKAFEADEAMLFRGITTDDGTEYRDKFADSKTHVTEHAD